MVRLAATWEISLSGEWERILSHQFQQDYFRHISSYLNDKWGDPSVTVIPPKCDIFKAFELTPFDSVKVVIIGQDPYPNKNHATGLSFGVPYGTSLPKSLINITNEVEANLNEPEYNEDVDKVIRPETTILDRTNMTLEGWSKQGVLMLNSYLTTEDGMVGAHQGIGWDHFTDQIVLAIGARRKPTVYMLWGDAAVKKMDKITKMGNGLNNSMVLCSTHPSPLSYNRGPFHLRFQGCRHFNLANQFLAKKGVSKINWEKTGG